MLHAVQSRCAHILAWWIRRNPLYLLSAVAMAWGARLYLVQPDAAAGEIGLILVTLGILQAYELCVSAVLLTLHRRRRSPEDQPSLLLVAALFWTGPLAATIELTAQFGDVGIGFAAAAAVIALVEMRVLRAELDLRLNLPEQALAVGCLMLLVATPSLLRAHFDRGGPSELALYAAWWILAAIVTPLSVIGCAPRSSRTATIELTPESSRPALAFAALVLAATAVHLWGMNYAFFAHARLSYAAPLAAILGAVVFRASGRAASTAAAAGRFAGGLLPIVGLLLAATGFDPRFPSDALPRLLRDPLIPQLALAACAWWIGAAATGSVWPLHAGSAAATLLFVRVFEYSVPGPANATGANAFHAFVAWFGLHRDAVACAMFGAVAYLLVVAVWRRSRGQACLAAVVNLVAISCLVWRRSESDWLIIGLALGWTWLAILHIARARPSTIALLAPLTLLIVLAGVAEYDPDSCVAARIHTLAVFPILVLASWPARRRELSIAAGIALLAYCVLLSVHAGQAGAISTSALAVGGAFALLAGGSAVSWQKRRLLALLNAHTP